jgi:hypothetical protein
VLSTSIAPKVNYKCNEIMRFSYYEMLACIGYAIKISEDTPKLVPFGHVRKGKRKISALLSYYFRCVALGHTWSLQKDIKCYFYIDSP